MIDLIDDNREAIADLCRQYGVRKLAVFGSAVNGTFDPETSDIDFAVDFVDYGPGVAKRFMRLLVALEDVLGVRIDIVTPSSSTNPYLLAELDRTAVPIYEAGNSSVAA